MFIASLCDRDGGCRTFGPFSTEEAARDWAMEAQEVGFFPHATFQTHDLETPFGMS